MDLPEVDGSISFGGLLRRHRLEAGLTQETLAERAELGVRSIQALEAGESRPYRETVRRLIGALDLTRDQQAILESLARPVPRRRRLAAASSEDEARLSAHFRSAAGSLDRTDEAVLRSPTANAAAPATVGNLPCSLTSFVGREREKAEVKRLLGGTRLLTLTGTGGSGKSRLALEVAVDLRESEPDQYPDGIWLVELAALADPNLVVQTVAFALGVREVPGQPILSNLLNHLRSRRLLLLVDNCEHLIEACASLASDLLQRCPGLRILATSREPLRIAGETSWRVPSLSLPDVGEQISVEQLQASEAIRLLVERAKAARPDFELTERNGSAVARICARLDGLPLAIELAAARVRALSADQISHRLDDRFRLLTSWSRVALPRQQTLRAMVDWSYGLLSEEERTLFWRLSVFSGGWSLEAAEVVCQGGIVESAEVLDLLTRLVDKSLVIAEESAGAVRYHFLETIRQYAGEMLIAADELSAVRTRHRDWCLTLAESSGFPQVSSCWFDQVEVENDNLRAALEWSRALDDREAELRIAAEMAWFWRTRSYLTEGRTRLWTILERSDGLLPKARIRALGWASRLELAAGDARRARDLSEEATRAAQASGDFALIADVQPFQATLEFLSGNTEAALRLIEDTLAIEPQLRWKVTTFVASMSLGAMLHRLGDDQRARPVFEAVREICRRDGMDHGIVGSLAGLAGCAVVAGELERARRLVEEFLSVAQPMGYQTGIVLGLLLQGDIARAERDWQRAKAFYVDALRIAREECDSMRIAVVLLRLSGLHKDDSTVQRSARLLGSVAAFYAARSIRMQQDEHPGRERDLAATREALGEEEFAQVFAEGQAMALEQAVEYALTDDEPE